MYTAGWREALWCSTQKVSSARAQTWTTCSGVEWTSHEAITAEISLKKKRKFQEAFRPRTQKTCLENFFENFKKSKFQKIGNPHNVVRLLKIILTHRNMIIWQPRSGNSELFQHIWVGKNFFNLINNNIKRIYSVNNFPKRIQM